MDFDPGSPATLLLPITTSTASATIAFQFDQPYKTQEPVGSTATVTGTDVEGVHVETGAGEQVVPRAVAALMWVVPA